MKEESRRRIARQFLEKEFGKYGNKLVKTIDGKLVIVKEPFELWRDIDSVEGGGWGEARAFQVIYAPYVSGLTNKRVIAVSDNVQELHEIVNQCFDQERVKAGCVEYETYKQYKIAYD